MVDRAELDRLSREALVERARRVGVERPEVMTRVELADEIVRRAVTDADARRRARGWLGVARDLVASLIEQGLNMPDAAQLVRRGSLAPSGVRHQPPVATVTLAEIYAAQGHVRRALSMLDEVIKKEPEHHVARRLRERLVGAAESAPPDPQPEPESSDPDAEEETALEADVELPQMLAQLHEPDAVVAKAPPAVPAAPPAAPTAPPTRAQSSLVLVRAARDRAYLYWELSDAHFSDPRGRAIARVVSHEPSWSGALRRERSLELATATGEAWLEGVPGRAVVRAALGFPAVAGFEVLTVAAELRTEADGEAPTAQFAPHPLAGPLPEAQHRAVESFARRLQD